MAPSSEIWTFADGERWILTGRTRVIGILNVTPDSFSDGGRFLEMDAAMTHALGMMGEGADAIDIGGESTRPGSRQVPDGEQIRRVVPIVRALRERLVRRPRRGELSIAEAPDRPSPQVRISVDTSSAAVAAAAIDAGADIVNDVTGLRSDPAMAPLLARTGAAVILMHMRGTPRTMQDNPSYEDLMREVAEELGASRAAARAAGVRDDRIVLDPGIGFGKTAEHNLEILARLSLLASLERPLLVGVSRKSFLGKVTGLPVDQRLEAGLGAAAAAVMNGASLLRVHDVAATVRMVRVLDAIRTARPALQ